MFGDAFNLKKLQSALKETILKPVADTTELGFRHVVALTKNMSEAEMSVDEACSNEAWGPHGSVLTKLANYTLAGGSKYSDVMTAVWKKLEEKDENWRMCYKALLLLEYLVKAGPEAVVIETKRDASLQVLKRLAEQFAWKDAKGNDLGANVRHRAKLLLQLLNSPEQLRLERERAANSRGKYQGVSSDQFDPPAPSKEAEERQPPPSAPAFDVEFPAFEADFEGAGQRDGSGAGAAGISTFNFSIPTNEEEPITWSGPPPDEAAAKRGTAPKKLGIQEALAMAKARAGDPGTPGAGEGSGGLAPPPPSAAGSIRSPSFKR